ncbi:PREDICTED: equilibrative nucleoside transporter 4-like [Amphimedon queenslandica]|uniref:Uncharacterized protein n=1 Tax=Amphimedon queenslandica TaxID=400682 RepID=A0A1X7V843_AMPQE|nr:PREDICTED: equilibrative nucleoside transporter 4-like [Amphimedon queenslandica]|eukprot:XP_019850354.1 PREDICTED: equilibrative nucleoside transporter 4-like [Amphimedon queenslandica]
MEESQETLVDETVNRSLEEEKDSPAPPPKDRYSGVYIILILLSLGFLTPFQSYVAGLDYFTYLYPNHRPELALPLSYLIVTLVFITITIGLINYFPLKFRICIGYAIFIISLSTVLLLDFGIHNCTISTETGFILMLLSVMFSGIGSGVQQGSYYGLSGMLPEKYTQAVMLGEAIAGSLVAINRIITKAASGPERTGTLIFFGISLLFIIACFGLQFMLWKSPFVKYYMKQNTSKESKKSEIKCIKNCQCLRNRTSDGYNIQLRSREELDEESEEEIEEKIEMISSSKLKKVKKLFINGLVFRYRILKKIWQPFISVFLIFFVTLLVFPSITSNVQYCKIGDWPIVINIALFNFSDTISRIFCLLPYRFKPKSLLIISILRLLLVPLLILCVTPSPTNPIFSPPFNMVVSFITITVIGATNGYFGTLGMQYAPNIVSNNEKELTGVIMVLILLGGLFVGSLVAFIWAPLMSLDTYMACGSTNDTAVFKC